MLIPAALQLEKKPEYGLKDIESYELILARQYSLPQSFSLRTFPLIQLSLGRKYGDNTMIMCRDYVHFKHDGFAVWVEVKQKYSVVQGTVAIPKELLSSCRKESLKNKCGKLAFEIFEHVIRETVRVHNPEGLVITKSVLSFEAMKKGREVVYDFQDVIDHYRKGTTSIHKTLVSDSNTTVSDVVTDLIINEDIQVILFVLNKTYYHYIMLSLSESVDAIKYNFFISVMRGVNTIQHSY